MLPRIALDFYNRNADPTTHLSLPPCAEINLADTSRKRFQNMEKPPRTSDKEQYLEGTATELHSRGRARGESVVLLNQFMTPRHLGLPQ